MVGIRHFLDALLTDNVGLIVTMEEPAFQYWPENSGETIKIDSFVLSCETRNDYPHGILRRVNMSSEQKQKTFYHMQVKFNQENSLLENRFIDVITDIKFLENRVNNLNFGFFSLKVKDIAT